jgi:protein-tyrosine phosphatase
MTTPFTVSRLLLDTGGDIALARMPGSCSLLEDDVAAILTLGPSRVLTLTPLDEMQARGAGPLPDLLESHAIAWLHFPVVDYGTPLPEQEQAWRELSDALHKALDARETILIHCLAGLGRTGMITLRLLVERGKAPADALARIRTVRPGAVERPAQYDWAIAGVETPWRASPTAANDAIGDVSNHKDTI